jgi:RNA 2',3'-cyclic 3'-phosphodiesterase
MPKQFSLPGFDLAPPHTLFFAVLPPASDLPRIEQRAQALLLQDGLTGKPIRADRRHVTLMSLGSYDGAVPQDLVDAASAVASALVMPAFEVVFDRALSFKGSSAFVLRGDDDNAPINAFRQALSQALTRAGLRHQPSNIAHMTLTYGDRHIPEHHIEPIRIAVEAFVLINSLVGQSVHQHLGRWPLAAGRCVRSSSRSVFDQQRDLVWLECTQEPQPMSQTK